MRLCTATSLPQCTHSPSCSLLAASSFLIGRLIFVAALVHRLRLVAFEIRLDTIIVRAACRLRTASAFRLAFALKRLICRASLFAAFRLVLTPLVAAHCLPAWFVLRRYLLAVPDPN